MYGVSVCSWVRFPSRMEPVTSTLKARQSLQLALCWLLQFRTRVVLGLDVPEGTWFR